MVRIGELDKILSHGSVSMSRCQVVFMMGPEEGQGGVSGNILPSWCECDCKAGMRLLTQWIPMLNLAPACYVLDSNGIKGRGE